jgi:hypothetical protein
VLLAIENVPINAWYGMFPQAPIGLLLSGTFLILTDTMSSQDFLDYGWRILLLRVPTSSSGFISD